MSEPSKSGEAPRRQRRGPDRGDRDRKAPTPFFLQRAERHEEIERAIRGDEPRLLDELAQHFGAKWASGRHVTLSVMRPVLGRLQQLRLASDGGEIARECARLRPLISYQVGRQPPWARREVEHFCKVGLAAVNAVEGDHARLARVTEFIVACIAYFRAAGGLL